MQNIDNLDAIQHDVDTKMIQKPAIIELENSEIKEIEQTFNESKDFRVLGEKIVGPMDSVLSQSLEIIAQDPIMNVSHELAEANKSVQSVYNEILDNDGVVMKFLKQIPGIGDIARMIDMKFGEVVFNIKSVNQKIEAIFSGFDTSYDSINASIDIQKEFLSGIEKNIGKIYAYRDFLVKKLEEFKSKSEAISDQDDQYKYQMFVKNVDFFINNLNVLVANLELARKRMLVRLDSSVKLALAMNSSRPIFKVLLSSAVVEISSQKAIDASAKSIETMGNTIDQMSKKLTESAIKSNEVAEKLSNTPVLDTKIFVENVEKLKNHFENIDMIRKNIESQSNDERQAMIDANNQLKQIRENDSSDYDQLNNELTQ